MKLIIDTSTGDLHIALWDKEVIYTESLQKGRGEQLGAWIPEVLKSQNISLSDISEVLVGQGPGSFTGLRTGIAFAQGLCAVSRPLYSCSTLEMLSLIATDDCSKLVSQFARPGLWYLGHYDQGKLVREWMGSVDDIPDVDCYILDDKLQTEFTPSSDTAKVLSWENTHWMKHPWNPSRLFGANYLSSAQSGVKPNYIQAPSAEVVLQQKLKAK